MENVRDFWLWLVVFTKVVLYDYDFIKRGFAAPPFDKAVEFKNMMERHLVCIYPRDGQYRFKI